MYCTVTKAYENVLFCMINSVAVEKKQMTKKTKKYQHKKRPLCYIYIYIYYTDAFEQAIQ